MSVGVPSFSLVVPTLNQGRFIRETLESALGQGLADLQLLVQDAGSTDGTLTILEEYLGRVELVSEPDRGQADAINRGLSRAAGEVLGYLNSDDLLLPGALYVASGPAEALVRLGLHRLRPAGQAPEPEEEEAFDDDPPLGDP